MTEITRESIEAVLRWQPKNAPGRHDQTTHGRRGGAGGKGEGNVLSPIMPSGIDMTAQQRAISTYFNAGKAVMDVDEIDIGTDASVREKIQVKNDLAVATGESQFACYNAIESWTKSSNDTHLPSLAMQEAAEEEFGSKRAEWQKTEMEYTMKQRKNRAGADEAYPWDGGSYPFEDNTNNSEAWPGDSKPRTKAFLRAQYDATQKALKKAGVTHVEVYRGIGKLRDQDGKPIDATPGTRIHYRGNAMESWSLTYKGHGAQKFGPRIVKTIVPVTRILSTPMTGFGCLHEYEVVVLGGIGAGDMVEVVN